MLLAHFDRNGAIEVVTRIELQALLVGVDIQLNPSDVGGHREDANIRSFWRRVAGAVKDEGIVVAGTVEPAVIDSVEDISSDLFRRGKIKGGTVDDPDRAVRYFNVVDLYIARRIGHVERVIQDCHVRWIGESVKVPIDVVGKHDGSWFVDRD